MAFNETSKKHFNSKGGSRRKTKRVFYIHRDLRLGIMISLKRTNVTL